MMLPKESKLATIAAHTGSSSSRRLSIQPSNHHHIKRSGGLALLPLSMSNIFLLIVITIMIVPASSFVLPPSHTCTSTTVMTTDDHPPVVSIFSSSQSLAATAKIQCWMSTSSSSTPEVTGTEAQRENTKEVITDKKNTNSNDETRKILERAKALIAVSRAKIEAQEQEEAILLLLEDKNDEDGKTDKKSSKKNNVPFFASSSSMNSDIDNVKKTEKVIKNKNEDTGLFTTDGDLMAKLSEEEEWESRSLLEVVEKTVKSKNVDRDIAKSIYNLRKSLQTSDFTKIFDKRNRFIGDP
mmetsp:Transcript_44099/g.44770  ORF Transcript_44099/g.44770 Transcript_44099/m.44770 type:complete len:297 (-) Transcript_44099:142-1032(-)